MATKLKISKVSNVNPKTKQKGFTARVLTNGKAGYEEIVAEACHNTTLHKAEAKIALELCMESAARPHHILTAGPATQSRAPPCYCQSLLLISFCPSWCWRSCPRCRVWL